MHSTKAAIALIVSMLIAGATAAELIVTNDDWLKVLTIALAAVNPLAVWSASNITKSTDRNDGNLP